MSEPIRRLVSKVLDLKCWNRRLSETQRILNYARSRPPIAKAISVLRLLSAATSWLFLWGIITALVELFIVETVSLGPRFGLMTTVVAPLVALPMAIWIALFKPRKDSRLNAWIKRHEKKISLLFAIAVLPVVGLTMTPTIMEHRSRGGDAEVALQSFVPIYGSGVDSARLDRTLAEFERSRRKLADQWWLPNPTPHISLYLFRDVREYKAYMATSGFEWSGGYTSCQEEGVTVGVPLENASNVLEELPASRTPLHEMVHATWCQSLTRDLFRSIPRWFHEGMAQWYENEGRRQFLDRALNRWTVWAYRGSLLSAAEFCGYTSDGSHTKVMLLYGTSLEFVRSLESGYGIRALNAVVEDVRAGASFDDSLHARFGGTCTELYTLWLQSL